MGYSIDVTQEEFDSLMENHYVAIDLSKYPDWIFRTPCPLYIVPQCDFAGTVTNDSNRYYYLTKGLEMPRKAEINIIGRGMYSEEELNTYLNEIHDNNSAIYLRDFTDRENKRVKAIYPEPSEFQKLQMPFRPFGARSGGSTHVAQ